MEIIFGGFVALVSSLATLLFDRWIREHGKTYIYIDYWELLFIEAKLDANGEPIVKTINSIETANRISYNLRVNYYNNAEVPVVLSDIRLEFTGINKTIMKFPQTNQEFTVVGDDSFNQKIIIELPSKKMTRIEYNGEFYDRNDFINIYESSVVYLVVTKHNGKKIRQKICDISKNSDCSKARTAH